MKKIEQHKVFNENINDKLIIDKLGNKYYALGETLKNKKLPQKVDIKIGKRSFIIKAGHTKFRIDYLGENFGYIVRNLSDGKGYTIKKGEEKTLGKLGDIQLDADDTKASRKHLKLRVDNENNIFLYDISRNGTFIDDVIDSENINIGRYLLRKINKNEIDELYKYKTSIKEASDDLIRVYGEPKYVVEIKGNKWLLTDKINRGERDWIIGYVLADGVYEPRFYRRSSSEGDRRCAPEMDGIRISKGENINNASYESTTKVDMDLRQALDNPFIKENPNKGLPNPVVCSVIEDWKKEINITKLFDGLPNHAVKFFKGKTVNEIKRDYANLGDIEGLDYKKMQSVHNLDFSYKHNYLGHISVNAYRINYKGENLIFYFSHATNDPKNQVWIENVVYENANINNSGLYTKQINFGPLAAKPLNYTGKCPKECRKDKRRVSYEKDGTMSEYYDTRDFYQENPIIKYYKKLECLL